MKKLLYILSIWALVATGCSTNDGTEEEYPDWQNRNEAYFEKVYQTYSANNIISKWSLGEGMTPAHTDCILVDRIEQGAGEVSPYYNDSVLIHYSGRLIPSTTHPEGLLFDKSFMGRQPDLHVDQPCKLAVTVSGVVTGYRLPVCSDFVAGFTSALTRMHRGDHWRVTIPYQLGYGTTEHGSIPAYSTLIFDIWLIDFWTNKRGDREN